MALRRFIDRHNVEGHLMPVYTNSGFGVAPCRATQRDTDRISSNLAMRHRATLSDTQTTVHVNKPEVKGHLVHRAHKSVLLVVRKIYSGGIYFTRQSRSEERHLQGSK
jgi:hypothetical protein